MLTAANGQEALRVIRDHAGPPVRLAISDLIMPLMGGKVMAEWLKTTYPDLKILFTSGYTDHTIARLGALNVGVEFLPKPYTPAGLLRKVGEMLSNGPALRFEAEKGPAAREIARDLALCAHGILQPDVFVVEDALQDPRFATDPLVTAPAGIRFYAGSPLITPGGQAPG